MVLPVNRKQANRCGGSDSDQQAGCLPDWQPANLEQQGVGDE